uniref:Uncharacterized protein n=1 Tax=Anolis carolinensis TaxID=28377 RepID=A0A803SRR5_ANOCA
MMGTPSIILIGICMSFSFVKVDSRAVNTSLTIEWFKTPLLF